MPELDDLQRRSDELEGRLTAFRAAMKPAPPAAPVESPGPPLWSWQWWAELMWLPFLLAWYFVVAIVTIFFIAPLWFQLGLDIRADRENRQRQ